MSSREYYFENLRAIPSAPVRPESGWIAVNIRFVTEAMSGFGEVCLFRASFPPGAEHQKHIHPHAAEFFYIISGHGASGCGEKEHDVEAGAFELVARGVTHWLRNVSADESIEVIGGYLGVGSLEEAGYVPVAEGAPA